LQETDADVVALVELSKINAARLERDFADMYPHQVLVGDGTRGKGLLSRYPILSSEVFRIETERPNIHAILDVKASPVEVYVVHPPSPDFNRALNFYVPDPANRAEVELLMARAAVDSPNTPSLLLGDFNFTDQSPTYRYIRDHGYRDAFRERGFGFGGTFRQRYLYLGGGQYVWLWRDPAITRIDYIWYSPQFTPVRAFVGGKGYSDHAAVIADLRLR
jgi:endonuclease/exonuclease/phosphatase family metal-dependent hydrolase